MAHRDRANWEGIQFVSTVVGPPRQDASLWVAGYCYQTEGEALIARLLVAMGVSFTPNVKFVLHPHGHRGGSHIVVPDFIFNGRAYLWCSPTGETLIHGLEAKGRTPPNQPDGLPGKYKQLMTERRVIVRIVGLKDIRKYFYEKGKLPIRPLVREK